MAITSVIKKRVGKGKELALCLRIRPVDIRKSDYTREKQLKKRKYFVGMIGREHAMVSFHATVSYCSGL